MDQLRPLTQSECPRGLNNPLPPYAAWGDEFLMMVAGGVCVRCRYLPEDDAEPRAGEETAVEAQGSSVEVPGQLDAMCPWRPQMLQVIRCFSRGGARSLR
ncbi:unnamed protein product [Lampetra fluviatilis]